MLRKDNKDYYFDYLLNTQKWPQSWYHQEKLQMTQKLVTELPIGSKILDAACGTGHITAKYSNDYQIYGTDVEPESINYCKTKYKGNFRLASLYDKLPYKDNFFDLILFHDSIEHFKKPKIALKNLSRVLKPYRKICVSTINYGNPMWTILENTWHRTVAGNCRTFSEDTHPSRYTIKLLRNHCNSYFQEIELSKRVFMMELFYIGKK
ncbi:MAG: 2 polyprenyl 3 methyl 5 hydroxy 6 metoxy 1 4 benzoquinol methylase [Candidatus Woesebacteria bacterium GW2011_GWA1_39_21]|uniref:2 polyprenyl 3 methyl 5 hydroxy 6 metoxy 1 4 benzoquinol methylase n=1 Tax=Candidatus Woesebacteria bacterium GW2011_GWA1_39_21 TaxID=1618550 RepID=A0A0G0N8W0_9BACT|nr:MAG: 2 polyprenyl 3 methyl 5 hydroxy 6 metoxy 1 4 benzoquinol methylase [Candidatus Woesebacteria bacterium GW2011_GWA1_39_21]